MREPDSHFGAMLIRLKKLKEEKRKVLDLFCICKAVGLVYLFYLSNKRGIWERHCRGCEKEVSTNVVGGSRLSLRSEMMVKKQVRQN